MNTSSSFSFSLWPPFASPRKRQGRQCGEFGFNVIAHASGHFGLAVAARNTLQMLVARGERIALLDVDAGGGRFGHDLTYRALETAKRPLPWSVNLFHVNPPEAILQYIDQPHAISFAGRLNVAVPFWELPRLPWHNWGKMLDAVDLVLAPSHYIRGIIERSCPSARVRHYPQAVFVPDGVSSDRSIWGLPSNAFVCFFGMDVSSDIMRKNPVAAFEAFRAAFPLGGEANVILAVKFSNADVAPRFMRDGAELTALFSSDPRVRIFAGNLPYHEALSLTAACDACISLHRAEGLGLNLMQAMSLGKPVVATDWSGNTDYINSQNSCPVRYRMVPVQTDHPSYASAVEEAGLQWADADVADAARWLRALYENVDTRHALGRAAAAHMDNARTQFLRGEWVDELRAEFESAAFNSAHYTARSVRLKTAMKSNWKHQLRRRIGNHLRRLGYRK
jgi:glycosyltransferase involved in cell wall biosynthesis